MGLSQKYDSTPMNHPPSDAKAKILFPFSFALSVFSH